MLFPIAASPPAAIGPFMAPNLTYWKSNPYLTSNFTGESDALHPQWVVVDLKAEKPVSAIRIAWASPYATNYQVEYWVGTDALDFDAGPKGEWKAFPSGTLKNAQGGDGHPEACRFAGLYSASPHLDDGILEHLRRARLGRRSQLRRLCHPSKFAVGTVDAAALLLRCRKIPAKSQLPIAFPPSIPGIRADDVNDGGPYQHTGFDLFFTSGLTNNLPAMIPVTMLYGTPDDAAAQIAYIEKRGYRIWIRRNGRGARWQTRHARRLWRALSAMGHGHSQG